MRLDIETVWLQAYAFISLSVVILSTITFVLSTTPQLAPEMDLILFDIEDENFNSTDHANKAAERWEEVSPATILKIIKFFL